MDTKGNEHAARIEEARVSGYNDAYFDGLYLPQDLPCQCGVCKAAYDEGQKNAVNKIFTSRGVTDGS